MAAAKELWVREDNKDRWPIYFGVFRLRQSIFKLVHTRTFDLRPTHFGGARRMESAKAKKSLLDLNVMAEKVMPNGDYGVLACQAVFQVI